MFRDSQNDRQAVRGFKRFIGYAQWKAIDLAGKRSVA